MQGLSKVIIAGNLSRDPEVRYTQSGTAIASFSVAVNRSWKDDSGQKKEEVTFVEVTAFGKQGETIAQYLKKGRPILMEGRLKQDTWEDKNTGQKRSKLGVVLESFTFLDSGNSGGTTQPNRAPSRAAQETTPIDSDDVPY